MSVRNLLLAASKSPWKTFAFAAGNIGSGIYANGQFVVATRPAANTVITSPTGVTWTIRALPIASHEYYGVAYGAGVYVIITNGYSLTSSDGFTWTQHSGSAVEFRGICFANSQFVALIDSSNLSQSSPDGINWTSPAMPSSAAWLSVAYGNGIFVATSATSVAATNVSPRDGAWTARSVNYSSGNTILAFGAGLFVLGNSANNGVQTSPDGITWTTRALPFAPSVVGYGGGQFVAIHATNGQWATSPDGITWTARSGMPAPSGSWTSIAYGSGKFVALGGYGTVGATYTYP